MTKRVTVNTDRALDTLATMLELDGMPPPHHRVRFTFKVTPTGRFEEHVPDLGDRIHFPDLEPGYVTRITHGTDKDGELYTVVVSDTDPGGPK